MLLMIFQYLKLQDKEYEFSCSLYYYISGGLATVAGVFSLLYFQALFVKIQRQRMVSYGRLSRSISGSGSDADSQHVSPLEQELRNLEEQRQAVAHHNRACQKPTPTDKKKNTNPPKSSERPRPKSSPPAASK